MCYWHLAEAMGIDFADAGMWDVETAYDGVNVNKIKTESNGVDKRNWVHQRRNTQFL